MAKKQKILESATKLFMQEGYGRVSMDQVTRESLVSKATVYAHFKNKNELFVASLTYYQELHQIKAPIFKSKAAKNLDDLYFSVRDYSQQAYDYYNTDAIVNLYRILIAEINEFPELFEMFFGNHTGITKTLSDFLGLLPEKIIITKIIVIFWLVRYWIWFVVQPFGLSS
ncbi:TetR/AcrR family transcriptional regulator [Aquella oligotrophica]|uniref:HTH tetR-type domain-containing protein n=1 Tax=Aquella oligotrophica TaxID=2067065 RepID=A0A2I7N5J1_9NEIS|nr:TetR/AcrR family transcriptional regulator [Aquella oligotrophica]AUR51485.1 hypothetical protein CUN60_03995 [Aquella oligotrophica]